MTRFLALRIPHTLVRLLLALALAGSTAVSAWVSADVHATGLRSAPPSYKRCTAGPTIRATWSRSGLLSVSGRCFTPGGAVFVEGFAGLYVLMFYWPLTATRGQHLCSRGTCYSTGGAFSHTEAVDDTYPLAVMAIDTTYQRSNIVNLDSPAR
jgi:hypothetical protein